MKISELGTSEPPRILIYGEVGCGKTALALTLGARAQVINMDPGGLKSGVTIDDKWKPERLKVDVKQFLEPDPTKRATAWAQMKAYIYELSAKIQRKEWNFDALILDNLSSYAENAVNQIMANSGKLGQAPEIQHWGLAFIEIKNVIAALRALPCVLVVLAHSQVKTLDVGGTTQSSLELAISGKNLGSQICRNFDEILYMRVKPAGGGKRDYVLQSINDALVMARSRSNLPNNTNCDIGLWEVIKKMGYVPPERKEV